MMRVRMLGGCSVAIGVVVVAVGVFAYVSIRRFVDRAAKAPGTVVRVEFETNNEGGNTFRPVVEFRTPAGARVEFKSRLSTSPASYDVGDSVKVLYEANAPNRAEIDAFLPLWLPALLCGIIGAVFLAVGTVVLRIPSRYWRPGHSEALSRQAD
jgi:hypothetical protein